MAPCSIDVMLKSATIRLEQSGSDTPSLDAAVLLCHVLAKPRSYLFTWPERLLTDQQCAELDALLARREGGEPVAYIIGTREFWSLPLKVAPSTLIPRPDTERLVEVALTKISQAGTSVLDLGTGTGAIALALASECPDNQVIGVDLRPEAVALATENAQRLGIDNVKFLQGSWFEPIQSGTKFAVIVSNPPYIDSQDPHLHQGDVRFEPWSALVADEQGFADIKTIAMEAKTFLADGGWLIFEHGYEQAAQVSALFVDFGYQQVFTEKDYAGHDRVTAACYRSASDVL